MKKIFSTFVVAAAFCATAFSQTQPPPIEIGINVGYNASTVSSGNITASYRSGFNAGVSAEKYFSDRWGLKVKAIYDQKGWNDGFLTFNNNSSSYVNTDYKLDYITVPVMANWHFGHTRNWYLDFGPYAGFLTSAKETALNTDLKNFFSSTDFGLSVGIGIKFKIAERNKLFIEYEGQGGISDLVKSSGGDNISSTRGSLNIGITF